MITTVAHSPAAPAGAPDAAARHLAENVDLPDMRATVALASRGMSDRQIARVLGCSERTITRRFSSAMRAYGARSRFHLGFVIATALEPDAVRDDDARVTAAS